MKHIFSIFLWLLLGVTLPAQTLKKPDLAFPKTVQKEAKKSLDKAEKTHNGDLLVAALCQLTLADCAISEENKKPALDRIRKYQAREKRTDILTLLRLLELEFQLDAGMTGFMELEAQILEPGEEVLRQYSLKDYPESVDPGNKEGQKYVCDLYDLVLNYKFFGHSVNSIDSIRTAYDLYCYGRDLCRNRYFPRREDVVAMEQYLERYPEGPFAFEMEEQIKRYYAHEIDLSCKMQYPSGRPLTFQLKGKHAKRVIVVAYKLMDKNNPSQMYQLPFKENGKCLPLEVGRQAYEMQLDSVGEFETEVEFPALPYGLYQFQVYDEAHPEPALKEMEMQHYGNYGRTSVSDLYPMTVEDYTKPSIKNFAVHSWTGQPLEDVMFVEGYPKRGEDCYSQLQVNHKTPRLDAYKSNEGDRFKVFTDLAIYRPGEKVQWSVVAYEPRLYKHAVDPDEPLAVSLRDCKNQELFCDTVTTDVMGMATGSFQLPQGKEVPLGEYSIQVRQLGFGMGRSPRWNGGNYTFEVAEYKAPTFDIEFDRFASKYQRTDTVYVRGSVFTLAGMPMMGQEVRLRVDGGDVPVDTLVMTDAEGRFQLNCRMEDFFGNDDDNEKVDPWKYWHWFMATASVTNAGGETQEAQSGFCYAVDREYPQVPKNEPDTCPANCPLWVAAADKQMECDGTAVIPVWTSASESYIYYIAHDKDQILHEGWLHYTSAGKHELKLSLPRKGSVCEMEVVFVSRYHDKNYETTVKVRLLEPKLVIETEVMREHLQPGVTETWHLRAHYDDEKQSPAQARLMMLLYHSALAQLRENRWNFTPQTAQGPRVCNLNNLNYFGYFRPSVHFRWQEPVARKQVDILLPTLQKWGLEFCFIPDLYAKDLIVGYAVRKTANNRAAVISGLSIVEDDVEISELADMESVAATAEESNQIFTVTEQQPGFDPNGETRYPSIAQTVQMRDSMTHVALFEPAIDTDAEGRATVIFRVPQDNATWLLEAVAYDHALHTAVLHKQIEVQRPVMVHPALPRFVRQGDKCKLAGVVQNASASSVEATVQVELYHPRTREVLMQKQEIMTLAVHEERALNLDVLVPDTLEEIGFRIVAVAEGCSDGEQMRLPVLPAAEQIVDSWVFYEELATASPEEAAEKVQQIKDSLLQVAGHPERYEFDAITSVEDYLKPQLAKVFDKDASVATDIAHSLWAQTVANNLCDTVVDLSKLVERLNALQNGDGGYSWMDHEKRQSSDYVTATVVYLMDRLEVIGYQAPDGLNLDDARQYLKDSTDYYKVRRRFIRRNWRHMSLADRGFAAQRLYAHHSNRTARKITRSLMEYLKEDDYYGGYWSIEHSRRNWIRYARCWFWRPLLYQDQLALTAHLTEVLDEVGLPLAKEKDKPAMEDAIRRARRWMMMSKRTTDWGNSSLVADAAYALLKTGEHWDESSHPVWGALRVTKTVPVTQVEEHNLHEVRIDSVRIKVVDPTASGAHPKFATSRGSNCSVATNQNESLKVGEKVSVAMTVTATQSMDYVTLKIARPACLEPLRQLSGNFWQGGLWGRCETRDTETRLYIEHMRAGTYQLHFEAYVTHEGTFAQPAVVLTCEYNPQFTVHSKGSEIQVEGK